MQNFFRPHPLREEVSLELKQFGDNKLATSIRRFISLQTGELVGEFISTQECEDAYIEKSEAHGGIIHFNKPVDSSLILSNFVRLKRPNGENYIIPTRYYSTAKKIIQYRTFTWGRILSTLAGI
jgi:hypothetical protein